MIVDAGGGTIDVSSYSKSSRGAKEAFEEVAAPQCKHQLNSSLSKLTLGLGHFHGSVFVTIHAKLFLESRWPQIGLLPLACIDTAAV